jgi:hypothetical protein
MFDESNYVQFPWKLHILLDEAESNGNSGIISWLPTGNAFKVHDKKKFAELVMPKYSQSNKYKSFQRNLNLWCFQTLTKEPNKGAIFHPYFIRGYPDRCHLMRRIKVKNNSMSQKISLSELRSAPPTASTSSCITPVKSFDADASNTASVQPFDACQLALLAGAFSNNHQQMQQESLMHMLATTIPTRNLIPPPSLSNALLNVATRQQQSTAQTLQFQQAMQSSLMLNQLAGGSNMANAGHNLFQLSPNDHLIKVHIGLALLASANVDMQLGLHTTAARRVSLHLESSMRSPKIDQD